MNDLTLNINGLEWRGWKSAEITRQVDAICGSFALGLAERWQHRAQKIPLAAGMACQVLINGESVINGYIDEINHEFSPQSHGIQISGRDKSCDLVDCSAIHSPGSFRNLNILELARIFCQPFGVEVESLVDLGAPLELFKLEEGETAFEALERALKLRKILAFPDGSGHLLLTRLGKEKSSSQIIQGQNVKSAQANFNLKDRFSDYLVKGQKPGSDQNYGADCALEGQVQDPGVVRYRPLLIRGEGQANSSDTLKQVQWEASTRAARSVAINVVLAGFHQEDGSLWPLGTLVLVKLPYFNIKQELLITKTVFRLNSGSGSVTELELKDPEAFAPEPPKKSPEKSEPKSGQRPTQNVDLQQASANDAWTAHQEIKETAS